MPVTVTSRAAFRTLATGTLQDSVLELIEDCGPTGCIGDELRALMAPWNVRDGTRTARCNELFELGLVFRNGDVRVGLSGRNQLVMRHHKYAAATPRGAVKKAKNPFLAGMMFAAKTVVRAGDYSSAKAALAVELRKAALR